MSICIHNKTATVDSIVLISRRVTKEMEACFSGVCWSVLDFCLADILCQAISAFLSWEIDVVLKSSYGAVFFAESYPLS